MFICMCVSYEIKKTAIAIVANMADHRFPGEHMYDDLVLTKTMTRHAIELIRDMPVIEGDVIIATYPKTGKTTNIIL